MTAIKKFTVFFKVQLKKDEIDIILKEFLDYLQKKDNHFLLAIGKPVRSYKGAWRVSISAKPESIDYICRKLINFLNREDYLDANAKVLYVSVPY